MRGSNSVVGLAYERIMDFRGHGQIEEALADVVDLGHSGLHG